MDVGALGAGHPAVHGNFVAPVPSGKMKVVHQAAIRGLTSVPPASPSGSTGQASSHNGAAESNILGLELDPPLHPIRLQAPAHGASGLMTDL